MLDMTLYEEDQPHYITDLQIDEEGNMVITFADGRVEKEKYSEHNYSYYRGRMVDQAKKYSDDFIKDVGVDYIKTMAIRVSSILVGLVGLYFLYNIDIHIVIKIIITVLALAGEAAMYFFTQLYLMILEDQSLEAFAYQEYLKHLENFSYYEKETGTTKYIFPIEDIAKHAITADFIKNINGNVEKMKEMGSAIPDMRLEYSKTKPNTNVL